MSYVSRSTFLRAESQLTVSCGAGSCLGKHDDLDAGLHQGCRTFEFTEELFRQNTDARTLRQDWGIVPDVIVSA